MSKNIFTVIIAMSVFTVSCAHKKVEPNFAKKDLEITTPKLEEKSQAKTDQKTKDNHFAFNCKLGEDSRTLILQKGDKRCEVHYTKSGNKEQIAWAEQTPSLCDKVFDQVKTTIEKGGFQCQGEGAKTAGF